FGALIYGVRQYDAEGVDVGFFFFQAEDGIRDGHVTGVQTCALPICVRSFEPIRAPKEIGSAPIPLRKRGRAEHKSDADRAVPTSPRPMLLADSFTMCQTAFSVMPSPHAFPTLLTLRNSLSRSIAAAA